MWALFFVRVTVIFALTSVISWAIAQSPESFRTPEFNANWGLGFIGAEHAYALGFTGAGVKLGIADGAIQHTHPEFEGRIYFPQPFPEFPNPDFDLPEHGTHVMGLAAAGRDNNGMMGVAFNASLAAVVAVEYPGYPASVDWVGDLLRAEVSVMNGSFGPPPIPDPFDDDDNFNPLFQPVDFNVLLESEVQDNIEEIERLSDADVVMVFAAGNEFEFHPGASKVPSGYGLIPLITPARILADQGRCNIGLDGSSVLFCFLDEEGDFELDDVNTWPADILEPGEVPAFDGSHLAGALIAVVAVDEDALIADFSNRCGETADWCMAAPGVDLLSSVPTSRYKFEDGTSMAAPLVAGSAAVLRQAFPYMTARQIIEVLLTNAREIGDPQIYGHGLLDLQSAIQGPIHFGKPSLIDGNESIFPTTFAVDTQGFNSVWSNDITGVGGFSKAGEGMLVLTGTSDYQGDTTVTGGELRVNGVIKRSNLLVESGGTLSGSGTVATTVVRGALSPGNSVGMLTVDGNLTLAAGSVLIIEVDANQNADFVAVAGTAQIEPGALFDLRADESAMILNRPYRILSASSLRGSFADQSTAFTFVDLDFIYQNNDLSMVMERNAVPMPSFAQSDNQRAVAAAIDSQQSGDQPFNVALLNRDARQLPDWFQDWSGEIYATHQTMALSSARLVSQRLGWRLQDLGGPQQTARQLGPEKEEKLGPWFDFYGHWERLGSSDAAASARSESGNVLIGLDHPVSEQLRLGGAFGAGTISSRVVNSRASTKAHHLALYGGGTWLGFEPSAGVVQSWYDVGVRRSLRSLPESVNSASSSGSLSGHSTAVFADVGLPLLDDGRKQVTPFVQVNHAQSRFGGFQETSGSAPLSGQSSRASTGFGMLGVRTQRGWQTSKFDGHVKAMAGWKHGWGDLSPTASLAFAAGNPFEVSSAPLARNALALEFGLSVAVGTASDISLVYAGDFGDDNTSQSVEAQFQRRF